MKIFKGITRNIILLGLVSLFTDLSSQMVFPLIPLFITGVLGVGAFAVGIVEGAAEATASFFKVVAGYWSDKLRKRKPFILFGYSISTITKPLFAVAFSWFSVLTVRIFERIGKGLRNAPRDALVAESCDEKVRGKAYGFQRALDGAGSVIGALLAFLLLPILGFRNVFLCAFLPGVVAVILIFFIKEKNISIKEKKEEKKTMFKVSFKELPPRLRLFIIIVSVFTIGHFGYAFLLLKAKYTGATDDKAILFYVLFYIVYTLCSIPAGALSDRIGRKTVLVTGYLLFACLSLGLLFTTSMGGVLLFFIIYGIFYAMIDGVQRAFVVDLSPTHLKGTALGTFHAAIGCVALPGGYIAGILWDKIGPGATFAYSFITTITALVLFVFIKEGKRKET